MKHDLEDDGGMKEKKTRTMVLTDKDILYYFSAGLRIAGVSWQ